MESFRKEFVEVTLLFKLLIGSILKLCSNSLAILVTLPHSHQQEREAIRAQADQGAQHLFKGTAGTADNVWKWMCGCVQKHAERERECVCVSLSDCKRVCVWRECEWGFSALVLFCFQLLGRKSSQQIEWFLCCFDFCLKKEIKKKNWIWNVARLSTVVCFDKKCFKSKSVLSQ